MHSLLSLLSLATSRTSPLATPQSPHTTPPLSCTTPLSSRHALLSLVAAQFLSLLIPRTSPLATPTTPPLSCTPLSSRHALLSLVTAQFPITPHSTHFSSRHSSVPARHSKLLLWPLLDPANHSCCIYSLRALGLSPLFNPSLSLLFFVKLLLDLPTAPTLTFGYAPSSFSSQVATPLLAHTTLLISKFFWASQLIVSFASSLATPQSHLIAISSRHSLCFSSIISSLPAIDSTTVVVSLFCMMISH